MVEKSHNYVYSGGNYGYKDCFYVAILNSGL